MAAEYTLVCEHEGDELYEVQYGAGCGVGHVLMRVQRDPLGALFRKELINPEDVAHVFRGMLLTTIKELRERRIAMGGTGA